MICRNGGLFLGAAGLWAVGPSFLLYTKASKPVPVSRRDHLHYTPALLILVLPTLVPSVNLGFYYHIGVGHFLIYFLAALWYFHHGQWTGSKKRFRLFAGSMGVIALTFLVQTAIGGIQVYALGTLLTLLVLYVVNFLILLDSRYLQERKSKKAGKHLLKGIGKDLERLFREEKLYRRKGLTLAEVARLTGHPAYLVSQTVNEYHGLKFNQFVNRFRIEEVKQRLRDLEANDKIEVIAVEVGFSSTSSLYAAFKRETDSTPQAFRRQFIHS